MVNSDVAAHCMQLTGEQEDRAGHGDMKCDIVNFASAVEYGASGVGVCKIGVEPYQFCCLNEDSLYNTPSLKTRFIPAP